MAIDFLAQGAPAARAAALGDAAELARLIAGGVAVDARDASGRTLAMIAARSESPQGPGCLRLLIQAGADVEAVDAMGWSAAMWAAVHCEESFKVLLEAGCELSGITRGAMLSPSAAALLRAEAERRHALSEARVLDAEVQAAPPRPRPGL